MTLAVVEAIGRALRAGPPGELGRPTTELLAEAVCDSRASSASGGRMRRGDPHGGTPSRLSPPYDYRVTESAHMELRPGRRPVLLRSLRAERRHLDGARRLSAVGHRV